MITSESHAALGLWVQQAISRREDIELALEDLGKLLRRLKPKDVSQNKIAQQVPIDSGSYSRIVNGKEEPSSRVLISIARVLGVRPGVLFDALAGYPVEESELNKRLLELPKKLSWENTQMIRRFAEFLASEQANDTPPSDSVPPKSTSVPPKTQKAMRKDMGRAVQELESKTTEEKEKPNKPVPKHENSNH